jgi:transcription factor MBP1
MRRKADSWMNATQILKVADFDKPQRTRILEREVQKGTHEKVQGGYGKYQGMCRPLLSWEWEKMLMETRDMGAV